MAETPVAPGRLARVGPAVAWLGALTVGLIALLATGHLVVDLVTVVQGLGGRTSPAMVVVTIGVVAAALGGIVIIGRLGGEPSRSRLTLGLGFGILIAIRLLVAVAYDGVADGELREYDELARGILSGVCCFSDRPMGYPMLLAVGYGLLGAGQQAVELLNLAFAVLAGGLLVALVDRLYGSRVAAITLYLYAIWPAGALMIATSLPHTSYELAIIAAASATVTIRPGWRGSALTGLLLGLSQYLRPSTPVLLPVYLLARAWPGSSWSRFLRGTLVPMVALFLVVLTPVIGHNLEAHGDVSISTSSYGGHGLWIGTDVRNGGRWSSEAAAEVEALPGADFWERSERAGQLAMERIRADPLGIALLGIRKQETLWGTEQYGVQYAVKRGLEDHPSQPAGTLPVLASDAFWALVAALAAVGMVLRRKQVDSLLVLLVAMILAVSATHALLEVRDRYHSYVVPLMLPFAAVAIVALLDRLQARRSASTGSARDVDAGSGGQPGPLVSPASGSRRASRSGEPSGALYGPALPAYLTPPGSVPPVPASS